MKEDLLRAWLPAWTLNDFDLALLHKVTVLHDVIECFDLECRVEKATLLGRIERDAVMQPVDPQIGDIADPVADFGPKLFPELEILIQVGRSHSNAMKLGDAGVTAGEIATTTLGWPRHQIDAVAGAITGKQGCLNVAKLTIVGRRAAHSKAVSAQPLLDLIEGLLIPDFDPDAETVIRTERNFAIFLRYALQAEDISRKSRARMQLACQESNIAD